MKSLFKSFNLDHALSSFTNDFIFIINGFWLLLFVYIAKFIVPPGQQIYLMMGVGTLLGMAHTISPLYLFMQKDFRKNLSDEAILKIRSFLLWWGIFTLGVYGATLFGQYFYGVLLGEIFILMSVIHIGWNYFHFGRQHFGVLHLYNMKQKRLNSTNIKIENVFSLLSVFLSFLNVSLYLEPSYNRLFEKYGIPLKISMAWLDPLMPWILFPLLCLGFYIIHYSWGNFFKIVYISMIALQPIVGFYIFMQYHFFFFGVSHWLTEIFLVGRLLKNTKEKEDLGRSALTIKSILYVILGGASISLILYWLGTTQGNLRFHTIPVPNNSIQSLDMLGISIVYFGITFWLSTMHFFMDRMIYSSKSYKRSDFLEKQLL